VKTEFIKKNKLKVLHISNVIIWVVSAIISAGSIRNCYNQLFEKYLSYTAFQILEIAYILVGLILLEYLYKILKDWAFLIYEVIWIMIILINLKIYFCSH